MNFFSTSLYLNLKKLFKNGTVIISTAVLFVFVSISFFVFNGTEAKIVIGLTFDENEQFSNRVYNNMKDISTFEIVKYDDIEKMKNDVAVNKLECGYIFSNEWQKAITGDFSNYAKVYISPSTISLPVTNELVFAALFKTIAPYVASNFLAEKGFGSFDDNFEDVSERIDYYYESGIFMETIVREEGEHIDEADNSDNLKIPLGIIALFSFLFVYFSTIGTIKEKQSGVYLKLDKSNKLSYLLSNAASASILAFITVALGILYVWCVFGIHSPLNALLSTTIYCVILGVLSFILTIILKNTSLMYSLFPIVAISASVFGGVFFNLNEVNSFLGSISYFFPTYYFINIIF